MIKRLVLLTILLVTALLTACATQNPYHPAGKGRYGYTDTELDSDRYRVHMRTQGESLNELQNMALRRAAELTIANGFDWFEVLKTETVQHGLNANGSAVSIAVGRGAIPVRCGTHGCVPVAGFGYGVGYNRIDDRYEDFEHIIEVKAGKGELPADHNGETFNAHALLQRIVPKTP